LRFVIGLFAERFEEKVGERLNQLRRSLHHQWQARSGPELEDELSSRSSCHRATPLRRGSRMIHHPGLRSVPPGRFAGRTRPQAISAARPSTSTRTPRRRTSTREAPTRRPNGPRGGESVDRACLAVAEHADVRRAAGASDSERQRSAIGM
jgi:hypothetical protein